MPTLTEAVTSFENQLSVVVETFTTASTVATDNAALTVADRIQIGAGLTIPAGTFKARAVRH